MWWLGMGEDSWEKKERLERFRKAYYPVWQA